MIISDAIEKETAKEGARRARVVVLGEFSAGKSTLINLLTAGHKLRTQVTATQMPAVWMSYGTAAPYRVDLQGKKHEVDLDNLSTISVGDTAYVRMFMRTPALELCDFIDTPGNSDPNIPAVAWERVAAIADVAVWCSPATQAWRQSELAAWQDVPERVRSKSILLITRADKLTSEEDRAKVLRRVNREAGDLFSKIHMVSLLHFPDVHDCLRDLIGLCRSVNAAETRSEDESEQVLQVLRETVSSVSDAPVEEPARKPAETAGREEVDSDFATTLWVRSTEHLSEDDSEGLNAAFFGLLEDMDRELAAYQQGASGSAGYATALWSSLTDSLSEDDYDGLNNAFSALLTELDLAALAARDFGTLKEAG